MEIDANPVANSTVALIRNMKLAKIFCEGKIFEFKSESYGKVREFCCKLKYFMEALLDRVRLEYIVRSVCIVCRDVLKSGLLVRR